MYVLISRNDFLTVTDNRFCALIKHIRTMSSLNHIFCAVIFYRSYLAKNCPLYLLQIVSGKPEIKLNCKLKLIVYSWVSLTKGILQ